ncbi:uncharacterized protein DNG_00726 [Cephalotrichum gorgonifer]|uniref:Uncharacterized protein n=1 Tax=Cephalotrichum gorgonifer TaxID=2041049 RepID=A0AAE8SR30_9PEZI|nr:uncharacterized protein DNG_00726 [Cephalotrichum gorgonifer]
MSLLATLIALVSLIPTSFALVANLITVVLFPLVFALLLGTAELISSILASIESVTLLVLSPPVLLFPFQVLGSIAVPLADLAAVVLAPALYPLQALLVFAAGIASFFLEFKLATAAILGLLVGATLHLTSAILSSLLGLDYTPDPDPAPIHSEPKSMLHARITHPVVGPPIIKSSLRRHTPVLRKHTRAHTPDGAAAEGGTRPRRVKFSLEDSGFSEAAG